MHSSKRKIATAMPSSGSGSNQRRKKAAAVSGGALPLLPGEIIMEIQLRLPVKSIFRFRAVCSSWAALFSTEEFCSLHMATPKAAAPLNLLFVSPREATSGVSTTEVVSRSSPSGSGAKDDLFFTLDSACGNSLEVLMPVSCHGLTLLYDDVAPAHYICNAATRAVTRLPPILRTGEASTGLGFDARTRKYKVVRLACGFAQINCEVYTLGGVYGDCWRPPTGGVPLGLHKFAEMAVTNAAMDNIPPVFFNGFLHWLVNPSIFLTGSTAVVISFSVAEETFSFVESPPFWETKLLSNPFGPRGFGEHLVEMDNQLCMVRDLLYNRHGGCILEIWKLPDDSSGAWWLKHCIDLVGRVARECQPQLVRVIGSNGNGRSGKKIIIATSMHKIYDKFQKKVHTYDLSSQALETILSITERHTSISIPSSRFCLFEESLAPVHKPYEEVAGQLLCIPAKTRWLC